VKKISKVINNIVLFIFNSLYKPNEIYKILLYETQNPTFVRSGWYWEF